MRQRKLDLAIVGGLTLRACDKETDMIEFKIDAMTCGHCAGVVTKTVQSLDTAAKVDIDLPTHQVKVDTSADRERLAAALADAGYPPN